MKAIQNHHPWLFSGGIGRVEGKPEPGDLVRVVDDRGRALALAVTGYGTLGLPPTAMEDLCRTAGFSRFQVHDFDDPASIAARRDSNVEMVVRFVRQ